MTAHILKPLPTRDPVYGNCIFCSEYGALTGEHMWDRWLRRHMSRDMKRFKVRRRIIDHGQDQDTVREKKGDPAYQKVFCVCADCNNEWMSVITKQAKPVILHLMSRDHYRLSTLDQEVLTPWIAAKVMVAEFSD